MIDKFRDNFREEAEELLNNLEEALLRLEDNPRDADEISSVFRCMHTIKGSAGMFGFLHVSEFAHSVETVLDDVRAEKLAVTQELIDLTLSARDHIRTLLALDDEPGAEERAQSQQLIERLEELRAGASVGAEARAAETLDPDSVPDLAASTAEDAGVAASAGRVAPGQEAPGAGQAPGGSAVPPRSGADAGHAATYRIQFEPHPEIYLNGTNPLQLVAELHELGDCTLIPYLDRVPKLSEFEPERCLIRFDAFITTREGMSAIRDVFMFVEGDSKVVIDEIDDPETLQEEPYKRLGEILTERGVAKPEDIEAAVRNQRRIGEMLVDGGVDPHYVKAAVEEQEHVQRSRQKLQHELQAQSIRVSSEKLDSLVDLVGELVTLQARLAQTASVFASPELNTVVESFERVTDDLRDNTMSVRMLPIGTTFSKFKRLVRDLANDLGKLAVIETIGGETELDKTVIERLNDPLVHIIRNSLDHGIEKPAARSARGKPETGVIRLAAEHSGAHVLITVADDGAGLDAERVRQVAVEGGVISGSEELSTQECYELIFAPGFSTAESVSNVSGRGVGMDVVKREIEALGGSVAIESAPGEGTTMRLAIPLTLAIIDGLLVRLGGDKYVVPLSAVEECIELRKEQRQLDGGRRMLNNRGEVLPYVELRRVFKAAGERPDIEQIVVVHNQDDLIGFVVDEVIGHYQTVIKNLGRLYRETDGISGATILGDGSVALILDTQRLATVTIAEYT